MVLNAPAERLGSPAPAAVASSVAVDAADADHARQQATFPGNRMSRSERPTGRCVRHG
jgi:glucose/arabinose dehydrogenase